MRIYNFIITYTVLKLLPEGTVYQYYLLEVNYILLHHHHHYNGIYKNN